ncbi:MAG TPA: aromatic ring-hydroxylating dioxygenase subunit alpha [Pirellulaceae bacterium]|nr:aromatic ring-hydroxylating dioxygenase subunit alpha [Pirellulaceae bacterium]HMO93918.1 aromatic ring-hydroxylating dioxygenase subunit alpha [Pirellulaceae bacterium]HMP68956.1 aromatic ring-hydroxylating dioxygenase subunit alpha [Pirellulaceae bacterium]
MTYLNSIEIGAAGQKTLPKEAYCSPEIFEREQTQIFEQTWLCVCRAAEIAEAGSYRLRQIGAESLIIVRDSDSRVHAHFNVCRHRGTRLCLAESGTLARTIQCPYHAWTYDLDGRLVGVPDEKQLREFCREDYRLRSAETYEWEGFVWIHLAEGPLPFPQHINTLQGKFAAWNLPQLSSLGSRVYDVAANWKLIVQNYSECYHCSVIHPALVKFTPPKSGGNDLVAGPFLGGFMDVTQPGGSLTSSGRACGIPLGPLSPTEMQRVYYYVIFPNMLLSLHHDYAMVHTLWPISVDRTRVECEWLFHPKTEKNAQFDPTEGIEFWDKTNREDWHVCQLTQLGVSSSRYQPGPYSDREAMVAAFDRHYLATMSTNQK